MQWMIGAMQVFMSKDTVAKMQWMSYGNTLHTYLGQSVPKAYGGNGSDLEVAGITPRYGDGAVTKEGIGSGAAAAADAALSETGQETAAGMTST